MQYITMQNKVVWDLLRRDGRYVADAQLSRERRDYSADAEQLGGATPIWVWYYPDLSITQLSLGDMFEDLRCEMSLLQEGCFDDFYMFELELDYAAPAGITHNASPYTRVILEIKLSDVVAVYAVSDSPVEQFGAVAVRASRPIDLLPFVSCHIQCEVCDKDVTAIHWTQL